MAFLVICGLALLLILWFLLQPWWAERRRSRLRAAPFPDHWRHILERRVPCLDRMPADLRQRLEQQIRVFVAEKPFIGCGGLEINDEIRVTVAAQACLLVLGRERSLFPSLRQILVYPGAFVVGRLHSDSAGVLQDQRHVLAGESWSQGQVVLSWEDAIDGAAAPDDGRNVVIHEFAHQLDQETGHANGAPRLARRDDYARWSRVLGDEFARLQFHAAAVQPSLINPYGATSPAEFFAVSSEVFFEQPQRMAAEHPELYSELARFYRVDPQRWPR